MTRTVARARPAAIAVGSFALLIALVASGTVPRYASDSHPPQLIGLLSGYSTIWASDAVGDLHGTVKNAAVLQHDDAVAVWIAQHATASQRFRALQDAEYQNAQGTAYDQSITISTGLGSLLGPLYVRGRESGALPLTSALVNSSTGSAGAYVDTSAAKTTYSHPRPYLPSTPLSNGVPGDAAACAPTNANASSQQAFRAGKPYADPSGTLLITRVPSVVDISHQFSPHDVPLSAGYGSSGICLGGSFPSGHTTSAYEAAITLATLLPEFGPELLARASEAGNNRIVLGVHYPLDVIGGRIAGEAAIAARWSDPRFRAEVLLPARAELVAYLEKASGHSLAWAAQHQSPYRSDPFGGLWMPGGTAQQVTDRRSAVAVFREQLTYAFAQTGAIDRAPSVPDNAANLLLTTFPQLTDSQRRSVLAQTEIACGYPLDLSASGQGSWQRLDLASAMSATVLVTANQQVHVLSTGTSARVIR